MAQKAMVEGGNPNTGLMSKYERDEQIRQARGLMAAPFKKAAEFLTMPKPKQVEKDPEGATANMKFSGAAGTSPPDPIPSETVPGSPTAGGNLAESKVPITPGQTATGGAATGTNYEEMLKVGAVGKMALAEDQAKRIGDVAGEVAGGYKKLGEQYKKLSDDSKEKHDQKMEQQKEYDAERDAAYTKAKNVMEEIKNTKINPGRVFDNMATGQKVQLVIGTFLAGMGDGPNQVLDMIDRMIARDIDAQKEKLTSLRQAPDSLMKLFKFKFPESPDKAADVYFKEYQGHLINSIASGIKGKEALLRAEQLKQTLETRKADTFYTLFKDLNANALAKAKASADKLKPFSSEEGVRVGLIMTGTRSAVNLAKVLRKSWDGGKLARGFVPWNTNWDVALKSFIAAKVYLNTGKAVTAPEMELLAAPYKRRWSSSDKVRKSLLEDVEKFKDFLMIITRGKDLPRLDPDSRERYKKLYNALNIDRGMTEINPKTKVKRTK